ncbi:MAG TPA: hemolysin secretion protein D, partial [Dehalococcoidia bacterium]|nr:hemolysin secretion protein D [Dehalococcoidia bacterium]
ERLGLVYSARIQLTESQIAVGNRIVSLSPGMSIKAEVKTDKRKVIDYFLSPLQRHVDESLVER